MAQHPSPFVPAFSSARGPQPSALGPNPHRFARVSSILEAESAAARHITLTPSESQRAAIEAELGPVIVLAGPGAGKTFCLIERIRFLIRQEGLDPSRICAFTFTNKAAEEIVSRLGRELGTAGGQVRCSTIHSFCAELLREFAETAGLPRGFGIADEEYQRLVLARCGVPLKWQSRVLRSFTLHLLRGFPLLNRDAKTLDRYHAFLAKRNLVDFDGLVLKAADLLQREAGIAEQVRARFHYVLVDEFQDLNPVQYSVIRELARGHRNLFAVGDDEQSIFSWTGADPALFNQLDKDFEPAAKFQLRENRRCPRETFSYARRLIAHNTRTISGGRVIETDLTSPFALGVCRFADEHAETAWIIDDLRGDRARHALDWGDYALLYRKHEIGNALEAQLIGGGIPCRLAHGRAIGDDPVVSYVIAALRVITNPSDRVLQEQFLRVVLPRRLCATLEAQAERARETVFRQILVESRRRPKHDEDGRKMRRGLVALRNLGALGRKHTTLDELLAELLSQRVGEYRTVLEQNHEELSDPSSDPAVVRLADRLAAALDADRPVRLAPMGGVEIPLKGMLLEAGFRRVAIGGGAAVGDEVVRGDDVPSLGIAVGLFKALQHLVSRRFGPGFRDFTAIDLETTERDVTLAGVVEMAAVRVRDGVAVEEFYTRVNPGRPISSGATAKHGLGDADVADAPAFGDVWPEFRVFCGDDVVVAHNGFQFDFRILQRLTQETGGYGFCTYDSILLARELHPGSRKLEDLAHAFGIDPGRPHKALDDTRTLARVLVRLEALRAVRARKTALATVLDHLGVALALSDLSSLGGDALREAQLLREVTRAWALGRYSDSLEFYRAERDAIGDLTPPTVEQLIARLGGTALMLRIRATRTADQRYPAAMARLRRLLALCGDGTLGERVGQLLEHVVLSRSDGVSVDRGRVNLLTLHSTKGLEFSRVYVVGVEDAELPGGTPMRPASAEEIEEGRRLLYVGMTRAKERLVLTRVASRGGRTTGGQQFLEEMGLVERDAGGRGSGD